MIVGLLIVIILMLSYIIGMIITMYKNLLETSVDQLSSYVKALNITVEYGAKKTAYLTHERYLEYKRREDTEQ